MVPGSAVRPARPQTPPEGGALVRCRVTSHGLSLRLERGGGVSAGLLHFPAGNAARWRPQARRIIEAGPGASGDGAQPPGDGRAGPALEFEFPGEAFHVGAADGEPGQGAGAAPGSEPAQVECVRLTG